MVDSGSPILADGDLGETLLGIVDYVDGFLFPRFGLEVIQPIGVRPLLSDWSGLCSIGSGNSIVHDWYFNPQQLGTYWLFHEGGHRTDNLKGIKRSVTNEDYNRAEMVADLVAAFAEKFPHPKLEQLIWAAERELTALDFGGRLKPREQDFTHISRHFGGRQAAEFLIGKADDSALRLHQYLSALFNFDTSATIDFLRQEGYVKPLGVTRENNYCIN